MSIDSLFTVQTQQLSTPAQGAGLPAAGALANIAFMELFLQTLEEAEQGKEQKNPGSQLLQSENPALKKDPSLDPATLLADNEKVTEKVKLLSSPETEIADTLALNQQAVDEQLVSNSDDSDEIEEITKLINGFIDSKGKENGKVESGSARDILERIASLIEDNGGSALIVANLTPQQINDLEHAVMLQLNTVKSLQDPTAKIQVDAEIEAAERISQSMGLGGIVQLIPPQERGNTLYLAQSLAQGQNSRGLKPANDLSAKLTDFVTEDENLADLRFEEFLKNLGEGSLGNKAKNAADNILAMKSAQAQGSPVNTDPGVTSNLSTLQGWPFSLTGSLFSSSPSFEDYNSLGLNGVTTGQLNGPGSLTNLVTQAHSAAQPHPATQMVAATIRRAVAGGEPSNITLQLDPPELGRVEVKMDFGKDKKIKTVITVEKPETLSMLQRDIANLERVLHSSGLDADAGIDFELAGENYAFGQNGGHENGQSGQRGSKGGHGQEDEMEILESTMTWKVDPETGHTRYNLWV